MADVGGDLLVQSLQDSSRYDSKQSSSGLGASVCVTGCVVGSVSANAGTGKMHSEYDSVTQQSGLWAGDGGFQVRVGDNTTLVGGGVNFGGGDDLGATKDNEVAGGATKEHGTSVPSTGGGLGLGMPVVAAASGDASSTTQSAISDGAIEIRDEAGQKALTGQTADQAVASVNWDTSDTLNTLDPIFDKEQIEAGFEIVSEANRQLGQFLTNRAEEINALNKRAEDASLSEAERNQAKAEAERLKLQWGPGGKHRRWMTAVMGAASGNVTGSTAQFAQAAVVNYLQGLAATEVKRIADGMGSGADAEAARAALHAIVGCAGAAGGGADCASGALGAGASSILNSLLARTSSDNLSGEQKEAHANLISGLVGAVALGAGADAVTAMVSARTETENNYLTASEVKGMMGALAQCRVAADAEACRGEVKEKYEQLSVARGGAGLYGCKADGEAACNAQLTENQAGSKALEMLEGFGWTAEEYAVIDSLIELNWNDERASYHAWQQAFYQEAGAPVPIGVGIAVGAAIKAEAAAAKAEALAGAHTTSGKAIVVDSKGNALIGDWSATKKLTSPENALAHWTKHGSEFPEYSNASQYIEGAQNFVSNPPTNVLTKTRANGDMLLYDPASNIFAVKASDGAPRTMFRPTDGVNYWNKQ